MHFIIPHYCSKTTYYWLWLIFSSVYLPNFFVWIVIILFYPVTFPLFPYVSVYSWFSFRNCHILIHSFHLISPRFVSGRLLLLFILIFLILLPPFFQQRSRFTSVWFYYFPSKIIYIFPLDFLPFSLLHSSFSQFYFELTFPSNHVVFASTFLQCSLLNSECLVNLLYLSYFLNTFVHLSRISFRSGFLIPNAYFHLICISRSWSCLVILSLFLLGLLLSLTI